MIYIIIAFIILLIICLVIWFRAHHKPDAPIMCFSGRNGSGKTFNLTIKDRFLYTKSVLAWWFSNKSLLKYFNTKHGKKNELYQKPKPELYSNYPVIIKYLKYKKRYEKCKQGNIYKIGSSVFHYYNKKYLVKISEPLKIGYIDNTEPFPDGSICCIDEFSRFLNQFITIKDKEYTKELENIGDNLTFWRHYHGNYSHLLVSSQCTNEINHNIRYKLNQSICYDSTKHILKFIHISKYRVIDLTDNIKSVDEQSTDNTDLNDKFCTSVVFSFKRYYDDRAFSERYNVVDNQKESTSPLKINEILKPVLNSDYNNILKTFDYKKEK